MASDNVAIDAHSNVLRRGDMVALVDPYPGEEQSRFKVVEVLPVNPRGGDREIRTQRVGGKRVRLTLAGLVVKE
jgi:hypothetical protein